jgi:DNA-binding CsgD family transcriptional regulator
MSIADYEAMNRIIVECYDQVCAPEDLPNVILGQMASVIRFDHWAYSDRNAATGDVRSRMGCNRHATADGCAHHKIGDRYPFFCCQPDTHSHPVLVTDFIAETIYHDTELYRDVLSSCDIEWSLLNYHQNGDHMIGFGLLRAEKKNFSERDRACFALLRPHLRHLHELATLRSSSSQDDSPESNLRQHGLTDREGQVLHWLSEGKSNGDIAQILGTRLPTVKNHVYAIYQKLGVENRASAMLFALRMRQKDQGNLPRNEMTANR